MTNEKKQLLLQARLLLQQTIATDRLKSSRIQELLHLIQYGSGNDAAAITLEHKNHIAYAPDLATSKH